MFSRFRSPDSEAPAAARAGRAPWRLTAAATVAVMLAAGVAGCKPAADGKPAAPAASASQPLATPPIAINQSATPAAPLVTGLPDFTPLVERVGPSVVNIRTMEKVRTSRLGGGGTPEEQMEELLRKFFGVPLPDGHPRRGTPAPDGGEERPTGVGSGFILSADGYIMTNAHVVDGADDLLVTLPDKREFRAKVVGKDVRTDVAVVKIDGKDLPAVRIGKVDTLKVGQWVMAIGSPFGLENTVTAGIVSAMQRDTGDYLPFIQTDVAINPGNSGGPLLNLEGEVVGINSQIFTRSGGFMGLSFAIPIDVALNVADQLKKAGKVSRGWLGVVIQEVNKDLAESFGLDKPSGALVAQLVEDGPAAKGGLQVGDVILSLNGQSINESADLPHLVGNMKPGDKINLDVIRNGQRKSLSMAVGSLPDDDEEIASMGAPGAERSSNRLGVTVADLTAEQRKSLDIQGGVVIKEVQDGPAAVIGLRPGDVITHLDNKAVTSTKIFADVAKALPKNRSVSMRVLRQGRASFITFKLAE